jgi:hypothetical protein
MAAPVAMSPGRVPCPLCGGPVHPIAGRCRHCRGDLTRVARPSMTPASSTSRRGRAALIAMALLLAAAALAAPILAA